MRRDSSGIVMRAGELSSSQGLKDDGNFSNIDRTRFRAFRDTIQAASGMNLSREELQNEFRKNAGMRINRGVSAANQSKTKTTLQIKSSSYGIISNFTEYQKNAYEPPHQSGRGKVWILKSNGKPDSITQAQISELLRMRHKIQPFEENDFTIRNQADLASTATETTQFLTILLASIASISLLVGRHRHNEYHGRFCN